MAEKISLGSLGDPVANALMTAWSTVKSAHCEPDRDREGPLFAALLDGVTALLSAKDAEIEQYRIQLAAVTRAPCTCDGDPVECDHQAARAAAEHKADEWKAAYEAKLADFARETLRTSRMLAACSREAVPRVVVGEALLGWHGAQDHIRAAGEPAPGGAS